MALHKFVTFTLNEHLFGLDILKVREINRHLDVSLVPQAPSYIQGLINLRGQIVTVINLKNRLLLGDATISEQSHNIILKTDGDMLMGADDEDALEAASASTSLQNSSGNKISFLVDTIGDIVTTHSREIEAPPANIGDLNGKYLIGVLKMDKTLIALLSVDKILSE